MGCSHRRASPSRKQGERAALHAPVLLPCCSSRAAGAPWQARHVLRRPAITVSFVLSGIAAICCAACYAEFAVEMPVAGSGP